MKKIFLLLTATLLLVSCKKNHPPVVTAMLAGPGHFVKDLTYTFSVVATDPDGDSVAVRFDWGDSTVSNWTDWFASGDTVAVTHVWSSTGSYRVSAQARDQRLLSSDWPDVPPMHIVVGRPPDPPSTPTGPDRGGQDSSYAFATVAFLPDSIDIAIRFAWGDNDTSDWSPFVASGESVRVSHAWSTADTYGLTAQARDTGNALSEWSDPHVLVILPPDTLRLPPDTPGEPVGPDQGGVDSAYCFTAYGTHPESMPVCIRFEWGDGDTSNWGQFQASGMPTTIAHAWSVADTYGVRAQARDTGDAVSSWSDPHTIVIRPPDTLRMWNHQVR
ncbi:hypothetical protein FJY68_06115 [candidate division WOR-3 bacterium]|uniref:PKD domain-containing protein n=1 Tax=candidate division WOR-3 bacterium TaxID=2052148 RepID=A0A937XFI3_UNCW3|nr:hypothetical protein [candidate division WOR-3 bacterium]